MSFASLGLQAELVRAVTERGYDNPTEIQTLAIPPILAGRDIIAAAQTGTGKTAGFVLPMLQRLMESMPSRGGSYPVRALVLAPTRELAAQVAQSVADYGRHAGLRSAAIFGGVSINPQKRLLARGIDVLVATPGRLLDHLGQGTVNLSKIEILVLDEADRMLDMGFIHDIRKVLAVAPKKRQALLFSATFSGEIRALARGFMNAPEEIQVAVSNSAVQSISQAVYPVDGKQKRALLSHLVGTHDWRQVLVFNRTKHGANRLAEQLSKDGFSAAAIHGNKSQNNRQKALADFKSGKLRILVATDIASRGLDIDQLPHVVNFDLPNVPEDYVHRIGRTGRAGREGEAISLVSGAEAGLLRDIERLLKNTIPRVKVEGYSVEIGDGKGDGKNQPRAKRGSRSQAPAAARATRPSRRRRDGNAGYAQAQGR